VCFVLFFILLNNTAELKKLTPKTKTKKKDIIKKNKMPCFENEFWLKINNAT